VTVVDLTGAVPGVRPVAETLAFAGRRLRHLRRSPARLLGLTLNPLLFLVVFGHLLNGALAVPAGTDYSEYLFAGVVVQVGLACVPASAAAVANDLRGGLVDRFRSLPVARVSILFGQTLADLAAAALAMTVVTAVGAALGWRFHAGPAAAASGFAVALAFAFVMAWVGVLIGLLLGDPESVSTLTPILVVVAPLLSNAFVPPGALPAWLRPVAEWNPITAVITACRSLWGNAGPSSGGFAGGHPYAAVLVALGLTLLAAFLGALRRYRYSAAG
jgi:ABC-2 type transport system permease protein